MKLVLRLAGSILGFPPDAKVVQNYSRVISKLISEGNSVAVVVGGGPAARSYINSARESGLSNEQQDAIGIQATWLNAKLVAMKLGVMKPVPKTITEMVSRLKNGKVDVMGGYKQGITTDAVSVMVAEKWHADLILKGSNQDGIYTADPRKNKNAKKLDKMTHARMKQILGIKFVPGMHSIVDPVAVKMLVKSKIKMVVFDGSDPNNALLAAHGKKIGTLVVS